MDWLKGELTIMAICWRIERSDGVTVGLTAHDRDLFVDGVMYRASPGMTPTAIARSDGLEPADMAVTGALDHRAITRRDLMAGRWDGARVRVFAADWTDPARQVPLGSGRIGAVTIEGEGFSAELSGAAAALEAQVAEETSPTCRASLGDRRCRVPMAGRTVLARMAAADGPDLRLDRAEPAPGAWANGRLRWMSGDACGLSAAVVASAGTVVTLARSPRVAVAAGTLVELREGCDGRIETCSARFGNAANFRGEPYLPGIDLLTRYPGA